MNDLKVFSNSEFGEIRAIEIGGQPWFVATDIAKILNYRTASDMTRILDDEEKATHGVSTLGGTQNALIINESGLYSCILKSIKPEAKQFRKWVTSEVLPSIRKTGQYSIQTDSYMIADPIARARRWIEEQEERLMLAQQVSEFKPKADYVDTILKAKNAVNISQIARDYGLTAQSLNQILHEERVQFKLNRQWLLYAEYVNKGYTKSDTHNYVKDDGTEAITLHTKWTQKGRLFIHDILTKRGINPVV